MKTFLLKNWVIVVLLLPLQLFSQNLVVNPSFEITNSNCANSGGENFFADLTTSWDNASNNIGGDSCSTPDLFSACNTTLGFPPTLMPNSVLGYQYSRTGTRHAGIITHVWLDEYREYIQGRLTDSLQPGQTYCVSIYVSLADEVFYATNNIGVYFSSGQYLRDPCPNPLIQLSPQLNYSCYPITDTTSNWVNLQWNYVATGGERFFTIGNFFNNANTTIINTGQPFLYPYAYYYIDDVSVELNSCTTDNCAGVPQTSVDVADVTGNSLLQISPNPGNNNLQLTFAEFSENAFLNIFSVEGKLVYSELVTNHTAQTVNTVTWSKGIYFVKLQTKEAAHTFKWIKE